MYKLLIVEDDVWEREGLASFLNWASLNMEMVGTATNGIQGLRIAKECIPDIILTDIRMPIMDGLELAREVKTSLPKCKIIVITGYDEFKYAKDAIHIGIYDYLLKPIQKEQLLNTINKAIREISEENQQEEYVNKLKDQISEWTFKEKEQFLLNLLRGNNKDKMDFPSREDLDLTFPSRETVAIVIRVNGFFYNQEANYYERQDHFNAFYEKIRGVIGNIGLIAVNDIEKREIIICYPVGQESGNEIEDLIAQIQQEDYSIKKSQYIIGVGSISNSVSGFKKSLKQAQTALDRIFFMEDTNILYYHDFVHQEERQESVGYDFLRLAPDYSRRIQDAAVSLDAEGVIELTEELFDFISNHTVDKSLVCNFLVNVVHELSVLLLHKGDSYNIEDDLLGSFHSCIKLEQLKEWIEKHLIDTNQRFFKRRKNKKEYIIDELMSSITNNYKDNIGLEAMADSLGFSPNYLGSLFKEHVGKSFTEVLTSFRMGKAEELLLSGRDSIKNIAKAVGFDNSSYFCTVFKKNYGTSPMEYRERNAYGYENEE